jgi:Mn-containing catalase
MKALDQLGKLDDPFFVNIPPDETVKLGVHPLPG